MANSGKMRSASDATKRSSVSKLLVKSTRSQKTSSSAKGRDNLGFAPGLGPRAGEMDGARLSVQEVDQRCAQWNAAVAGGKSTVNESVERVKKPSDIGHRAAVTKVLDEAPFAAGRTGRNEGHAAPGRAVSKFGSTTALESLTCGLSPESPIYEELDFKCSSFRDLNSDPERRLESPDTSNSSADLSLPRHGLPFSMRHARHRSHNAIPSCGVRIAELRASRKYEGARTSPSSVSSSSSSTSQPFVKTTNSSSDRIHSPRSSDSNLSLRKDSMSPDTLLQVQSQHEKHRSSLDLNVTYVEYFDETNPVSTVAPPAALLSPNPRDSVASSASLSSCSSSIPSEAEPQTLSSVSLPTAAQTDFTRSGRYTTATGATNSHAKGRQSIKGAAAAAWAMPGVQVVPSVPGANCRSSQRNADAGSSRIGAVKNVIVGDKAKSVLRSNSGPTEGFSPDLQPDGEGGLEKETGILCLEVTDAASSSFGPHRPISRFLSEPDNSSDCSAVSLSSSPTSTDTLIDSVPSNTSLAEDTANNDLASPEATDDDNNKHSNSARHLHAKPGQLTELPKCHAVNKRPSQLLGPAVIQGQAQRRPVKMADFNSSAEANQSPLSCLNKREALSKAPNPQIGQPNSSSKSIIQRLETFGRSTEWKGGKSHSGRLPKSSSVDLPKQIASAPNSSSKTSKTKNTAVGVLPCSTAVQQIHSHSQRGRAAVIPVKSTVRRAQSSDSHTPSARNNVSLALSKVNNHNCAMRNPDLGTEESVCSVGPSKDAKALSPTSVAPSLSHGTPRFARSNSSPVCSNRLRQFSPAGEVTCRPEKSSAKNSSSSGDSSVPGFRLQQQKLQPLSPIAERSTQQRSSVSSSVTPTANGSNNSGNTSRGNASPRIVPFTSAKGVPLPTYRNLSFSQRATSMSKIPTGKSSSPISAVTPKNAEVERQTVVQTDCRMDKAMLADRSLLQMNETISRSHTSIYERSTREPSALREATEKQRFNSCSCQTLNTCADPSKAGFLKHVEGHINQTPDSSGRKLNNKTSVKLRDVEVNVDPDPPPPPCPSGQTPENASVSRMDEASEAKLKPVSSGEPPKTTFLRKLRTPTDFASGRKSETGGDRNSFRSAVVRGDSGASALNNNSTSESKLNSAKDSSSASTSVFRQLQQMKHVKPYASASHRIADKFTRSRRSEEVDSCCHLNTATGHVDNHAVTCQEVAKDGDTADRHPSNAAAAASASSLTPACMNSCSADSAGESQNGVNDNFALSNSSSPEVAVIGDKNAQTLSYVDGPCRDNEDICDPNLIDDRLDDNTESFEVKQSLSTGDDFVEAAEDPSAEVAADGISLSESRTDDCASGKQFVGDQPFSLPLQRPNVSDGDESQCVAPAAEERFDSVRTLAATDVPRRRQKEPSKQDHGSQTTLSDINLIGDGIILKPTNRNSLLLIEPENSIRDIDKFVVTYESDNIIVLERADSISTSVTSSRDSRGECVLDMTTAGHDSIVSTSMHGDIVRKFGKDNTMSTSRSADIKAITSPKTETGTIPLSESGYDSWKSQSSKSSSRLLKLSESDVYAIPSTNLTFGRLSETEMSDESCFMYKDNRNYLADERIRSYRERNACIDDLFGSVDKMNSRTIIADESQQLGDDEEEEHGLMQICDSEGSRLSSNIDREKPSTAGSRGCSKEPVPQTSAGEERFVGFSYSFSSFPSSSSSLLETLDGINLSRTGSDERLTTLEKPWNRRSSVDRPRSGEFVDQNDQADDLAFGSWTELNPNPAAYHSRDYHNRIYKLDFGTGDSAEMIINQDDPDLCPDDRPSKQQQQQQQQRLDGVLAAAKHRSSSHAHSKVSSFTADSQLQSINYLHNSKSGPLQRTATDSGDFSPFAETHGTHSKTFPIAIKKACVECFQAQEAQTIAENCQVFAKTHKLRQRPEKETFYENMCDAMLESLDPDLSDSDNSPHSSLIAENSAKFDYSNSAVTVESGTRSTPSDKCSEIKLKSEDQRINLSSSQEFSDRSVKPHNKSDEGVSRPIKPTLTSSHTIESAAGFQTISSDAKMAPEIKLWKISTDNAESGNQSKNPANVLSQCRPNPSVVEDKHLATDGPLNIGVDLLWISQYCIDEQKYRVDAQNKLTVVPEEVVIDNRSERVSRVMAVSPGHDISRNSDNATCDTDCVAAESSVNVNSRSSPEVSLPTPPTKEGGKSSTNILTRYLPALRRKSSKDRYSTHDAAAAAVGRSDMCTVSRNSAPISLDGGRRESAERHQEPRSVKEVIRQFEDKTAATLAVNSVDPAKCVTAAPVLAQEQKGKKSKFTKKPN